MRRTQPETLLKTHGLRRTRARLRILEVLKAARKPLSQAGILAHLGTPRPDRVSVYRALDAFVEAGFLHRAYVDDRTSMFELADRCGPTMCHPHFYCRKCREIFCLPDSKVPRISRLPKGFIVERQKVSLEGLCPKCRASGD